MSVNIIITVTMLLLCYLQTDGLVELIIIFLTELAQLEEPTAAINSTAEEIVQLEIQLAEVYVYRRLIRAVKYIHTMLYI